MQLSRIQQVIGLMIIWAAALVGVDKALNHSPMPPPPSSGGKPQLGITFTHFCCSGCYDKMFSAAKSMSWILRASTERTGLKKPEEMSKSMVDVSAKADIEFQKDATFELDDRNLDLVDLIRADREFRAAGLVPGHMILENIPHFQLVAVDPHLCCPVCEEAATNSMKREQMGEHETAKTNHPDMDPTKIQDGIMLKFDVDKAHQMISAEFRHSADVTNFRNAMERAGFSPREIRIHILGG